MSVNSSQLLRFLDDLLLPNKVQDYCPNGLQVQGKPHIKKLVTGVTACQALIEHAIEVQADAILVHHGYFWKGESPCITGMKYQRIKSLLAHDINLYAYHLPLDIHPVLGNNAQLAKLLGIEKPYALEQQSPVGVLMAGEFPDPKTPSQLVELLNKRLGRPCLYISAGEKPINTVAWCTGGGQNYIELAAQLGIDAFITGEVSEQTVHIAREMGIHFFAAGHHATERYGVKAIGELIQQQLSLPTVFVDIDNTV
jgi:dinuclear metal center YbgI/SA1388 family protein